MGPLTLVLVILGAALRLAASPVPIEQRGIQLLGREAATDSPAELAERDNFSPVRNELGECKAVTIIFARGTIELGNVGLFAGPPFFNALDDLIGEDNVAVQGVDYPATIGGYLKGGDTGGAATLAALTKQAATQCPDTQIVLSGYSQGAQVVHLGAAQIDQATADRVAAVVCSPRSIISSFRHPTDGARLADVFSPFDKPQVLFGDPKKGQAFPNIDPSKVDTFCFLADLICDALPVVDTYHLSYAVNGPAAAAFVSQLVNV